MTLKRKATLLILVLLFLAASVGTGIGITKFAPGLIEKIDSAFAGSGGNSSSRIPIDAVLEFKGLDLKGANSISIAFENPTDRVSVNSESLDLSNVTSGELTAEPFDGSINITETANLSGKTQKLAINEIAILPNVKSLNINGQLNYNAISLDLSLDTFSYTSSGSVSMASGKATVSLDNEKLDLQNFVGIFVVSKNELKISGTVDNVRIAGKEINLVAQ